MEALKEMQDNEFETLLLVLVGLVQKIIIKIIKGKQNMNTTGMTQNQKKNIS